MAALEGAGLSVWPVEVGELPRELAATSATAVVCADDETALLALRACRGYAVPSQVSVTGLGDARWTRALHPRLTTVRLPADGCGARAADAILSPLAAADTFLPCKLIVRQSTGPAPS